MQTNATSTLQKVASTSKFFEVNIHDPIVNSCAISYVIGGCNEAELFIAHTDSFVWVFKLTRQDGKTNDLASPSMNENLKQSFSDLSDANTQASYDLICASQITQFDSIRSVLVLNVKKNDNASAKTGENVSSQQIPAFSSWNCIAVGFKSGLVKFLTEFLQPISEISWSESDVKELKVENFPEVFLNKKVNKTALSQEQFTVVTADKIFYSVSKTVLSEFLIEWKLYKAKVASSGNSANWDPPKNIPLDDVTKWTLLDQEETQSVFTAPKLIEPTAFEHLKTASILGGPNARPKPMAPRYIRFISAGSGPYSAVYDHVLGGDPYAGGLNLTKMAHNYASRLKSSFWSASSSFLYGQAKETEAVKMKEESLNLRISFSDSSRAAEHAIYSPIGNLLAIADNLSRVMLVDVMRGLVIRVFKGYRNARLAWYVASNSAPHMHKKRTSRKNKSHALFLVIHATKRAIVEVWPMKMGHRAAAFNVSKNSVLLYNPNQDPFHNPDQVLLLDVLSGDISRLSVPYHFAFSDLSGARQKDILVSTRIVDTLAKPDLLNESLGDFLAQSFSQLSSATFVLENLNLVSTYEHLDIFTCFQVLDTVNAFLKRSQEPNEDPMELDDELHLTSNNPNRAQLSVLKHQYERLRKCNELYQNIWELYEPKYQREELFQEPMDASDLLEQLEFLSHSSNKDFKFNLFHIAQETAFEVDTTELTESTGMSTITAQSPIQDFDSFIQLSNFFQFFELDEQMKLIIRKSLTSNQKAVLGAFLFFPVLKGETKVDCLLSLLSAEPHCVDRDRTALLDLLLAHWLSEEKLLDNYQDSVEMLHLHSLVSWMLETPRKSHEVEADQKGDEDEVKSKWEFARKTLQCSRNVTSALTAAIMIRGICISFLANQDASESKLRNDATPSDVECSSRRQTNSQMWPEITQERWFKLSYDIELFNLLIYRLEDCVLFAALNASSARPNLLSVDSILAQGKGALSEFLARWLIEQNISCAEYKLMSSNKSSITATMLQSLHKKLPISLKDDYVFCQTAWLAAVKWSSNPDENLHLKILSLDYLSKITDQTIKCGTAHLLWSKMFHRLVLAIWDHMNKALDPLFPKSMNRDLNIRRPEALEAILDFALQLFDEVLLEPSAGSELSEWDLSAGDLMRRNYDCEDHWVEATRGNQECVPELSQKQPRCNYALLLHMRLLLSVLGLSAKCNLFRLTCGQFRPLSLFDQVQVHAFSQLLHSFPLTSSRDADATLIAARQDFIARCFIELAFSESSSESDPSNVSDVFQILYECGGALDLSSDWLLQTHLVSLYWLSMDQSVSTLIPKLADQQSFALRLIEVLAFRVQTLISDKAELHGIVSVQSRVPANLSMWLQTNKAAPWILERAKFISGTKAVTATCSLANLIMRFLPQNHSLFAICQNCVDALKLLDSI